MQEPSTRPSTHIPASARAGRLSWAAQILAAVILGQTLFFKFTAAPEAVELFTQLGAEPFGRIAAGISELAAVVLLLIPATAALGGLLAAGIMVGAIASHLAILGIEVNGDGGTLFGMAIVVLFAGLIVVWIRRRSLPIIGG